MLRPSHRDQDLWWILWTTRENGHGETRCKTGPAGGCTREGEAKASPYACMVRDQITGGCAREG